VPGSKSQKRTKITSKSFGRPDLSNSNLPRTNRASTDNSLAAYSKQPKSSCDEDDKFEHGEIDESEAPTHTKSNKGRGKGKEETSHQQLTVRNYPRQEYQVSQGVTCSYKRPKTRGENLSGGVYCK